MNLVEVFKKITTVLTLALLAASLAGLIWSVTLPNLGLAVMFMCFMGLFGFFSYRDLTSAKE